MKYILFATIFFNFLFLKGLDQSIVKAIKNNDHEFILNNFLNIENEELIIYKDLATRQEREMKILYLKNSRSYKDWAYILLGFLGSYSALKKLKYNWNFLISAQNAVSERGGLPKLAFKYETLGQRSVFIADHDILIAAPGVGILDGLGILGLSVVPFALGFNRYFSKQNYKNSVAIKSLICNYRINNE